MSANRGASGDKKMTASDRLRRSNKGSSQYGGHDSSSSDSDIPISLDESAVPRNFPHIDAVSMGSPASRVSDSSVGSSPIVPSNDTQEESLRDSSATLSVGDVGNEQVLGVEVASIPPSLERLGSYIDEQEFAAAIFDAIEGNDVSMLRKLVTSESFNFSCEIEYGEQIFSWVGIALNICRDFNRTPDEVTKILAAFASGYIADLSKSSTYDEFCSFEMDLINEIACNALLFSDEECLRFMGNVSKFCLNEQKKDLILNEIIFRKVENLLQGGSSGINHLHEIRDKFPQHFNLRLIDFIGSALEGLDPRGYSEVLLDERFYGLFVQDANDLKITIIRSLAKRSPDVLSKVIEKFPDDFLSVDFGIEGIDFAFLAVMSDAPEVLAVLDEKGDIDVDSRYQDTKVSLLHLAAFKSPGCAKYLADKYPQFLSVADRVGKYPLNYCFNKNNVDTLGYLFKKSPEDVRDQIRFTPIKCYDLALRVGLFDVCEFLFENNHPQIFEGSDAITPLELVFYSDLSQINDPDQLDQVHKWNSFVVGHSLSRLGHTPDEERGVIIGKIEARDADREGSILQKMVECDLFEYFVKLVELGFDINKMPIGGKTAPDFFVEKYRELEGQGDLFNKLESAIATMTFKRVEGFGFDKKIRLSGGDEISFQDVMKKCLYREMKDPANSKYFPVELRGEGNITTKIKYAAMGARPRLKYKRSLKDNSEEVLGGAQVEDVLRGAQLEEVLLQEDSSNFSGGEDAVDEAVSSVDAADNEISGVRSSARLESAPASAVELLKGEEERKSEASRGGGSSGGLAGALSGGRRDVHHLSIALIALLLSF